MTEQEKKLVDLMCDLSGYTNSDEEIHDHIELAKAIIEAFPQITKKPVKIDVSKQTGEAHLICDYEIANNLDKFESEYFVEVINE